MRRAIHISWPGSILLRGCCVVEREFMLTVNNMEEGGTVVSKIGGRFCAATGEVTLGGREGTNSKAGFHGMGGHNDLIHRSVGLMVVVGNTSWERMYVSSIMAVRRAGFCCWRRASAISILLILTPRRHSFSVSALFRLKKDSSSRTKVSGSWRAAHSQRSRRGFCVSQDESTQPRASITLWSAPESNERGVSTDSVTVWWPVSGQHKGRAMLEQRLRFLFGDPKGAVEWS